MALERHQEVAQVWNWLPAFRAAAEYESLQRAALALSVSPSALSRSIRLLEEALGVSLFTRSPSGLSLTSHGQHLLAATRDAMRLVYSGFPAPIARVKVGAVGPVLNALLGEAVVCVLNEGGLRLAAVEDDAVAEQVCCGELDLALAHHAPLKNEARQILTVEALPSLELVLAGWPAVSPARVASLERQEFASPGADLICATLEGMRAVSQRLRVPMLIPRCLVPEGTPIVEEGVRSVPVFIIRRREVRADRQDELAPLVDALRALLGRGAVATKQLRNLRVDEVTA
jgi:DNA-binding transcriptional LysR family regulator